MTILMQYRTRVPDVQRLKRAYERHAPLMEEMGGRVAGLFASEDDPSDVTIFEAWGSREAMSAASEKYGGEFDAEAGTEGLPWETRALRPI